MHLSLSERLVLLWLHAREKRAVPLISAQHANMLTGVDVLATVESLQSKGLVNSEGCTFVITPRGYQYAIS